MVCVVKLQAVAIGRSREIVSYHGTRGYTGLMRRRRPRSRWARNRGGVVVETHRRIPWSRFHLSDPWAIRRCVAHLARCHAEVPERREFRTISRDDTLQSRSAERTLASTQPTSIVDRRDRVGLFAKRICSTNRFIERYDEVHSTKVEDDGAATRHEDCLRRKRVAQIIREFGNARARFVIVRRIHQHS